MKHVSRISGKAAMALSESLYLPHSTGDCGRLRALAMRLIQCESVCLHHTQEPCIVNAYLPSYLENLPMFDRQEIYSRFESCFLVESPAELARLLGVHHTTIFQWKSGKRQVPWNRLKSLVDDQNLSWDWLIEGKEPKHRRHAKKQAGELFDRHGINQRFLSLFPDYSNAKLGKELDVNGTTVFKWRHDMEQVSWERLKYAVDTRGATWEWLIEGR